MTPPPPSLRDTSPNTTAKLHLPTQLSMSDLGEAGGGSSPRGETVMIPTVFGTRLCL
jgi:hypothetical protein